jgi:hypothetical protein
VEVRAVFPVQHRPPPRCLLSFIILLAHQHLNSNEKPFLHCMHAGSAGASRGGAQASSVKDGTPGASLGIKLAAVDPNSSPGAARVVAAAPRAAPCKSRVTQDIMGRFAQEGFQFLGCTTPDSAPGAPPRPTPPAAADATTASASPKRAAIPK